MIRKQQILSILVLLSLGAIFTTNLKATKNTPSGNAFIIGSMLPCIYSIGTSLYMLNKKNNSDQENNKQSNFSSKAKIITTFLIYESICLSIGWLLKKYLTGKITKHVKNNHVQNIVMVVSGIIAARIFIALNNTMMKNPENNSNNIQ